MKNKEQTKDKKKSTCNNLISISPRANLVYRQMLMSDYFTREVIEQWKALPICEEYHISSWGRVIHLKSYKGKKRELVSTFKMGKYPFVTITLNGKRKGFSLRKMVGLVFSKISQV
jgi:hypothetical protein